MIGKRKADELLSQFNIYVYPRVDIRKMDLFDHTGLSQRGTSAASARGSIAVMARRVHEASSAARYQHVHRAHLDETIERTLRRTQVHTPGKIIQVFEICHSGTFYR